MCPRVDGRASVHDENVMLGAPQLPYFSREFHCFGTDAVLAPALRWGSACMLVAGLVAPEKVLIRNDVDKGFMMPTPMTFGANSAGVGLVGTF